MTQCEHEWIRRPSRWECGICFEDAWDCWLGDDNTAPDERPLIKDQQIAGLKSQVAVKEAGYQLLKSKHESACFERDLLDSENEDLKNKVAKYKMRHEALFDAVESELDHDDDCECDICVTMVTFPKEGR